MTKFLSTVKLKFLFIYFLSFFLLYPQSENTDIKKTPLWKGHFVSVYDNRVKIEVNLLQDYFQNYQQIEIVNNFKSKGRFQVYSKFTDEYVGDFLILKISLEENKISLLGKVLFSSDEDDLTISYYIAEWQLKQFYFEPDKEQFEQNPTFKTSILYNNKEMVYIPAGEFLYGQGTNPSEPSFNIHFYSQNYKKFKNTKAFYIDKYEVTNEEYANFLKDSKIENNYFWKNSFYSIERKYHPVIGLTYREAEQYASWSKKRLPTEIEWEKAARGPGFIREIFDNTEFFTNKEIIFPFGNNFDPNSCNTSESNLNDTISIYDLSKTSASPFGVVGMCGNVSEWTSSFFKSYTNNKVSNQFFGNFFKVIRGGNFSDSKIKAKVYHRDYGGIPNLREDRKAGLRLVLDIDKVR